MQIKNIILYGAPGVGKTHNYKNLISMIEEGRSQKEIFESISRNLHVSLENDTFEKIKEEKRVEFVTFHQSYSYEDFIEGFRPQESGNIELEEGVFKVIAEKAINNIKEKEYQHISFEEAYDIFREQYLDGELEVIKTVSNATIFIREYKERFIKAQTENAKDIQHIKKSDLETTVNGVLNNQVLKPADIKKLDVKKDAHSLAGYYFPFAQKIVDIMKENKIQKEQQKNFYIVIDEINRGNISKIFGELITLIEEDKRDKYEVTLPYSKTKFKVPSNLYIIATMNSTDKSIATIDIALRRRFTFLKMKPNEDLVANLDAKEFMQKANDYIKNKLSEDYMLGHSYFMGDIDLDFIKEYKVKPLLEEYFYADEKSAEDIMHEIENTKENI
jgi:5-methylcytosine-specific restriction protein B